MAEMGDSPLSLLSLGDELICSICLSPFDSPVTLPCGHNFCQECLGTSWKDSNYSCPQCRTVFPTKPDLKKNTVLSTVVETYNLRSNMNEVSIVEEDDVIRCDTCMETEASKTCLTCMASFCEEHLRSHRENPVLSHHQLTELVGDLSERICSDHHKLMEFFCSQHGRPICSSCLQQVHKGCSFVSFEEQRNLKESDLRGKLDLLDQKIVKNEDVISQTRDMQNKLKDSATNRKKALATEYQQLRDMLTREENDALIAVDSELESGQTKLKGLMVKFSDNINNMNKAKEDIHSLLSQSQTLAFLQDSFKLPAATNFDPHTPRINLDSKKVRATQAFVVDLKEYLTEIFKQPVEIRQLKLQPGEHAEPQRAPGQARYTRPTGPGFQSKPGPMKKFQKTSDIPPDITSAEKRTELLKYATVLTVDPKTAHKRIALSEDFTMASFSDEDLNYPDSPERFEVFPQVLTSEGFSTGRHYWEVQLSSNNFIGVGLAYSSIDRKGPTSRLGRNAQSWCVEWFNGKLSAWYNNSNTMLANPNSNRIGVLLDCEEKTATFYHVEDRAYPLHSFVFPFSEAVYPAFWIVSKNSFLTLSTAAAPHSLLN